MEQNNFEKKIKQKLDELKIQPSDAVWENVEKNINKQKDRKRILIFFLLFVCMVTGGYFIFNSIQDSQNLQNQLVSTSVEKDSKQTKNKDSYFNQTRILPSNDSEKNNVTGVNPTTNKTPSQKIENNVERTRINATATISDTNLASDSRNENTKEIEPGSDNRKILPATKQSVPTGKQIMPDGRQANNPKNDLAVNSPEKIQANNIIIVANGVENVREKNIEPQHEVAMQSGKIPVTISTDTNKSFSKKSNESISKIPTSKEEHKWKFGITVSGGTSMIGDGSLSGDKANNLSSSAQVDFISMPTQANNYTLASLNSYFTPSPIKNSMAFIGGVFVEKNISRKNKIDIGISYKYYSLTNTTGNKIDFNIEPSLSAENLYSSWSNIHTYRNNFHYIEIPVSFKFQLGNSETLPIYWSVGVNISQLISSNSLQFKSSPGLYYNDNSLYNKTQLGLQTGFSALLFAKTKIPINIGSYFSYNTSKMANDGLYSGKHFSFIGIKAEILLGKK